MNLSLADKECIFCRIVIGNLPCYQIFEDSHHLGFLTIFPNTEAFSVVIPKAHHVSDFAQAPADVVDGLMMAARVVATKIVQAYEQVERCALVFEGIMVDHLHAKIIPLHASQSFKASQIPHSDRYFTAYEGYITTIEPAQPAQPADLQRVADKINQAH